MIAKIIRRNKNKKQIKIWKLSEIVFVQFLLLYLPSIMASGKEVYAEGLSEF